MTSHRPWIAALVPFGPTRARRLRRRGPGILRRRADGRAGPPDRRHVGPVRRGGGHLDAGIRPRRHPSWPSVRPPRSSRVAASGRPGTPGMVDRRVVSSHGPAGVVAGPRRPGRRPRCWEATCSCSTAGALAFSAFRDAAGPADSGARRRRPSGVDGTIKPDPDRHELARPDAEVPTAACGVDLGCPPHPPPAAVIVPRVGSSSRRPLTCSASGGGIAGPRLHLFPAILSNGRSPPPSPASASSHPGTITTPLLGNIDWRFCPVPLRRDRCPPRGLASPRRRPAPTSDHWRSSRTMAPPTASARPSPSSAEILRRRRRLGHPGRHGPRPMPSSRPAATLRRRP